MIHNKHLIKGLELDEIEEYIIDKTVQVKKTVEELGWTFHDYDSIDGKFYVTIEIDRSY